MKKSFAYIALISFALTLVACNNSEPQYPLSSNTFDSSEEISSSKTSSTSSGPKIVANQLSTESGLKVNFDAKGARITSIEFEGKKIAKDGFTVGRVANRIANGKFTLNGTEYNVHKNVAPHSLHGGDEKGRQWSGTIANATWSPKGEQTANSIAFTYHSPDKENGYPGNMDLSVKYTLTEQGELSIEYEAKSDQDTLCNPTNHLFIAINGNTSYSNINLQVNADNYTPLASQIPTGEIATVEGTQFDYRTNKTFDGSKSYDDNYVLNGTGYRKAATLSGSSVKVDVHTDRAGLQLYKDGSGNICLETQQFPDMINHPEFDNYGTTILRANETFTSKTTYHFSKIA